MTLVEVLAGLAILGSLLASILIARGRFTHQWTLGQDRARAIAAADHLLTDWWRDDLSTFPTSGSGTVEDAPDLRWEVTTREPPELEDLQVQTARLEVFRDRGTAAEPLAAVEVLIPIAPIPEEATP